MLNTATVEATFEVEDETAQTSLSNTISHTDFVSNLNTAIANEDSLSSVSVTEASSPESFTVSSKITYPVRNMTKCYKSATE